MNEKEAAHKYRLAQAQKLLDLFEDANGHAARTMEELSNWLASASGGAAIAYDLTPDGEIIPDYPFKSDAGPTRSAKK